MASVNLEETNALGCRPFPDVREIRLEDLYTREGDGDRPTSEIVERLVEGGRLPVSATKFNSSI
jgi:hypothetical protein